MGNLVPISRIFPVFIYRCQKAAVQCGSCVVAKKEYVCGWCENYSFCSVKDACSSGAWIKPQGICPKVPEIDRVCGVKYRSFF